MYKANNYSRLVNGEIWICYITNQNIFKTIQRCFIANFHNFSTDIIHYKIFTHITSLITAPAEFDVRFTRCSQTCTITTKQLKSPKLFFADGNFLYSWFKINVVFMSYILLPMAKYFMLDRPSRNFLLLFLKIVYPYLFTFTSIFVLHKAR